MKNLQILSLLSLFVVFFIQCAVKVDESKDKNTRLVGPQSDGSILVPTNQLLRPAGFQLEFNGRPVDLSLSPDGNLLAVLNKSSLEIIRVYDRTILQRLKVDKGASYNGIIFSDDGSKIFVSQARDKILIAQKDRNNVFTWNDNITFDKPEIGGHAVPGGINLDEENNLLYVTLNRSNSLAVVNLSNKSINEIPVGLAPYEVLKLSSKKAYVSNWGGRQPRDGEATYKSSKADVLIDPNTGIANNGSVSVIDLLTGKEIKNIEVGLHPTAMILSPNKEKLYVACANSDLISVIDTKIDKVVDEISVSIDQSLPFGNAPNALTIS